MLHFADLNVVVIRSDSLTDLIVIFEILVGNFLEVDSFFKFYVFQSFDYCGLDLFGSQSDFGVDTLARAHSSYI